MPSENESRLTRWTPAVAGVIVSVAAACSGGADAAYGIDPFGGIEDSLTNAGFDSAHSTGNTKTTRAGKNDSNRDYDAWTDLDGPGDDSENVRSVVYVDVEHARTPDLEFSQAIAHVARGNSPGRVAVTARLVGLSMEVPNPGRCIAPSTMPRPSLSGLSELSLLDAGAITIHARPTFDRIIPEGASELSRSTVDEVQAFGESSEAVLDEQRTVSRERREPVVLSLAPRAFPSVSSLASGVVYTSRDRVTRLPDSASYQVDIAGGREVGPLTLTGEAPEYLDHVTLSGLPINQVQSLDPSAPIDITWDVGAPGDVVFVELIDTIDGGVALRCSFADAAGSGTVPAVAEVLNAAVPTDARVSIHRYRRVAQQPSAKALSRGELRFDFELSQDVSFE